MCKINSLEPKKMARRRPYSKICGYLLLFALQVSLTQKTKRYSANSFDMTPRQVANSVVHVEFDEASFKFEEASPKFPPSQEASMLREDTMLHKTSDELPKGNDESQSGVQNSKTED